MFLKPQHCISSHLNFSLCYVKVKIFLCSGVRHSRYSNDVDITCETFSYSCPKLVEENHRSYNSSISPQVSLTLLATDISLKKLQLLLASATVSFGETSDETGG